MKNIVVALTFATLTACSSNDKPNITKDNTFIIKPIDIESGQGDKRIIVSFTNEYSIEKKITILFESDSYTTELDLCEKGDFAEQMGKNIDQHHCPFLLTLQHFTDNQYRVAVRATFLNGFRVNTSNGIDSYFPITSDRSFNGILPMENNRINFSFAAK